MLSDRYTDSYQCQLNILYAGELEKTKQTIKPCFLRNITNKPFIYIDLKLSNHPCIDRIREHGGTCMK